MSGGSNVRIVDFNPSQGISFMRVFILFFRFLVPAETLGFAVTPFSVLAKYMTFSRFQKLILKGNWPDN
jgi:hypothetical protein